MRSPFYFIVKPINGKRYENTKSIGGIEFIISTSDEDHRFSNRQAEVIELPIGYTGPVQVSDILIVHHNVFKFYNDIKGRQRSGRSFFRDDLFFVDGDQFFLFKHDGVWHSHDRYCFVKPIPVQETYIKNFSSEEDLMGVMAYPSQMLVDSGVKEGDTVCFRPDNKYEFTIDGEKMYRMYDHQITAVI